MDLELCFITTRIIIKGSGGMEISMERGYWLVKMVLIILVSGKRMWLQVKEYMSQFTKTRVTMANG